MYQDSSMAPLLNMRRWLKVVGVLSGTLRNGISLSRSSEFALQWDCVLRAGPVHPVSLDDLLRVRYGGIGWFHEVVARERGGEGRGVHRRLCEFIHRVVVFRRDEAVRGWREWLRERSSCPFV